MVSLPDAWDSSSPPPTPRPLCRRLVADASASSAAIGKDGTLYLGDRGNTLNAFDPDGNVVWLYSHGHEGDIRTSPVIGPESSPGANDGLIYIGFSQNLDGPGSLAAVYSGPPPPLGVGGTLKWSYTGGNFVNTSSPALDNGTVYFGDILGWFHAVNADTGAFLWKVKIGNQISASPVIVPPGLSHAGRIYVGSTNGVSAVDPATHDLDPTFAAGTATPGTFATDGAVDQTPALGANGTIYAGAKASKRKTFYAINPDGTLKWVFGPIQTDADNAAFAIVSGEDNGLAGGQEKGTVYVAIGKTVYALRPADGTVLWSYSVPMNIISFPAISGGATWQDGGTATLYVPSYDGNVYALSSYRGPQGLNNTPPTVTASASSDGITVASPQSLTVAPGQSITFNGIGIRFRERSVDLHVGLRGQHRSVCRHVCPPQLCDGRILHRKAEGLGRQLAPTGEVDPHHGGFSGNLFRGRQLRSRRQHDQHRVGDARGGPRSSALDGGRGRQVHDHVE